MKEAIQQKKVICKKICENRSEENKARYRNTKNRTNKVVANSMRKESERVNKLKKKNK